MELTLPWDGHAMLIWGLILVMLCKAAVYCAIGCVQCTSALEDRYCGGDSEEIEEICLEVISRPPREDEDPYPFPDDPFPDEDDGYERMRPTEL